MGYLDSFADPLFKTDAEGRTVFFPVGVLGRGRIVPDAATGTRLRNTVKFGIPILIVIIVIAMNRFGMLPGAALSLAFLILYQVYLWLQVRGLPFADARLTLREARQRQADALGMGWLLALATGSAVLAAASLAMTILEREELWVGVLGTIFFGACLIVCLNMIRLRSGGKGPA